MNYFVTAKKLHVKIQESGHFCPDFFFCDRKHRSNSKKNPGRIIVGLIAFLIITCSHLCYAQAVTQQQTVGSILRWTEPLKSTLVPPIKIMPFRVEPAESCRLDLSLDNPQHPSQIEITVVFLKPGTVHLTNGSLTDAQNHKITLNNHDFTVKNWPGRPPRTAIQAGVGPLKAEWIFTQGQKPQAGRTFTFQLRIEDLASLGVDRQPIVSIRKLGAENFHTAEPALLTALKTGLRYDTPQQTWEYEWTPANKGSYRLEPILFSHLMSDNVQTLMLRGFEFSVAPRSFKSFSPVDQPLDSPQVIGSWHWLVIPTVLILIPAGASHPKIRRRVRIFLIRLKLRRIQQKKLERTAALVLYRTIEKDWYAKTHRWNTTDQAIMERLSEQAFAPDGPVSSNVIETS